MIYPVFTIAQLELCLDSVTNPFERPRPIDSDPINAKREDLLEEWEVTRVMNKRVNM